MKIGRVTIRAILFLIICISLYTLIKAIVLVEKEGAVAWNVVAASLAVMTAIISAFAALRLIEAQEDSQNPHPEPFFDVHSRYGLVQLAVKNYGGGTAHDIKLLWDIPVTNGRGELIKFTEFTSQPDIPVLLPGETTAILVDSHVSIFKKHNLNYSGTITFKDASNKKFKYKFYISLETYRKNMTFLDETPKTHFELQKIPDLLSIIQLELKNIGETLNSNNKANRKK